LTTLDTAIQLARMNDEANVQLEDVARARDGRLYHQSADTHYDQISAFIKSVRGSDPNAALYWLVTLLESGESARFIARRLVILASEDVGLADPLGLLVAESAARAVEFVGLPEARLTLAHATLTLSLRPKSNSATRALAKATAAVQSGGLVDVPAHLRDASYASAAKLGHGAEYRYAHDYPDAWVDQQYLPDRYVDAAFFDPSPYGREGPLVEQWRRRTSRSDQDEPPSPVE
ncbi:MAG: replication-associated recombination protein A, partial [Acidimicrobiales bacterium]